MESELANQIERAIKSSLEKHKNNRKIDLFSKECLDSLNDIRKDDVVSKFDLDSFSGLLEIFVNCVFEIEVRSLLFIERKRLYITLNETTEKEHDAFMYKEISDLIWNRTYTAIDGINELERKLEEIQDALKDINQPAFKKALEAALLFCNQWKPIYNKLEKVTVSPEVY